MGSNIRILLYDESDYLNSVISPLKVDGLEIQVRDVADIDDLIRALDEFQPHVIIVNNRFSTYESLTILAITKRRNPELPYILFYDKDHNIREAKSIDGASADELLDELQLVLKEFSNLPAVPQKPLVSDSTVQENTLNVLKELCDYVFLIDEDGFILSFGDSGMSAELLFNNLTEQHINHVLDYYFEKAQVEDIKKLILASDKTDYEAWTKGDKEQKLFQVKIIPALQGMKFVVFQDSTFVNHTEQILINRGRILDNLQVGIITVNLDETITYCNAVAQEMFAFRLPNVYGKAITIILPLYFLQTNAVEMKKRLFEKGEWAGTVGIKMQQSGVKYFGLRAILLRGNNDAIAGVMYLYQKVEEGKQYFYSSEDYYSILEGMRSGLCVLHKDRIVYANEAFGRMLGYSSAELMNISFLDLLDLRHKESVVKSIAEINQFAQIPDDFDVCFTHKNGISMVNTALEFGFVQPADHSLVYCFVREKLLPEPEVQEAPEDTLEDERSADHDMRTSLNAIVGFADILKEQFKDSDDQNLQLYINHILASSNKLQDILETQSFEVESVKEKHSGNVIESIIVSDIIVDVINGLQPVAARKKSKLSLRHMAKIHALADVSHLRQVLISLVNNSLDNIDSGSVIIDCGFDTLNNLVFIKIRDNRKPISEDLLPLLLDPITESVEGYDDALFDTNMAFSSAKRLLETMNGRLEVRSAIKSGLIITIQLPFDETSTESTDQKPSIFYTVSSELIYLNELHPYFLIVEDDPGSSKMLEITLKNISRLDFAPDGDEALAMIRNAYEKGIYYDLMLFDIGLPEPWTGITLRERIVKDFPEYAQIPFVAQTAYVMKDDKHKIINAGFEGFISKPIDRRYLIKTLASIMMKHRNQGG
jgi:PAS domain S-box-containing protein